jgi:hypothetical protein
VLLLQLPRGSEALLHSPFVPRWSGRFPTLHDLDLASVVLAASVDHGSSPRVARGRLHPGDAGGALGGIDALQEERQRGIVISGRSRLVAPGLPTEGDALAWKRANPEAYRALVLWAKEDVANGVRPSMDAYGHLLRRPHLATRLGLTRRTCEPVLFNDHLTSSLARLLRREHGIPFSTRQARVDGWMSSSCS